MERLWVQVAALAGLSLLLFGCQPRAVESEGEAPQVVEVQEQPPLGDEIRDIETILRSENPLALSGRSVVLENAPVRRVLTNRAFLVGEGERVLLVVLDEVVQRGSEGHGLLRGDTATLYGTLRTMDLQSMEERYNVGQLDEIAIGDRFLFLEISDQDGIQELLTAPPRVRDEG